MDTAPLKAIKDELKQKSPQELSELVLSLGRARKENKELLTYLLFYRMDEQEYIRSVKEVIDDGFARINDRNFYYIKKSVRKILREVKKFIRYSKLKETEVALLMHFCVRLSEMHPSYNRNTVLGNLMDRQQALIRKAIDKLHPDLQYDYLQELDEIS
jgi:membrane-anchored protein YejM (alkaline phosphatase superfamily)